MLVLLEWPRSGLPDANTFLIRRAEFAGHRPGQPQSVSGAHSLPNMLLLLGRVFGSFAVHWPVQ